MKRIAAYALLTAVFAFLASGAVIAAYLDNPGAGAKTMWLIVPVTLFFMVAVAIDMFYAIPRLLLRRRSIPLCFGFHPCGHETRPCRDGARARLNIDGCCQRTSTFIVFVFVETM